MLSYIAGSSSKNLIENVCKELNITILSKEEQIDFLKYIKETKVNFRLIQYIVIDLNTLKNTKENQVNSICYFKELYPNIRIIIIAKNYDDQDITLTKLYEKDIYNIINLSEDEKIINQLKKCIETDGMSKKDGKRFRKIEETKVKKSSLFNKKLKILKINKKEKDINQTQNNSSVYFFTLFIQAITKLIEVIGTILIFALTSIGLTIIFNESLRNMMIQIFKGQ